MHGPSPDMMNRDNAHQIANNKGKRLELEKEAEMQNRGFIRIKSEVNVYNPLLAGFWSMNARGTQKNNQSQPRDVLWR